ncbi:hypothetical protein EJ08DRAFT_661623 [Tothia fuscella]|uniref:Polynucleotide 5'-hydroxyl-kinase GRC3 n=1 Tax=Tothia fuscella TaxID=1048955 RepID=A0A9P4TY43_9PEZI|nr:hypothetical protein EJ08DRAFT_661623 [Tothia fuscella]
MSKKRKADTSSLPIQRKRSPNAISVEPLSAFAAARAKSQVGKPIPAPSGIVGGEFATLVPISPKHPLDKEKKKKKGKKLSIDAARLHLENGLNDQVRCTRDYESPPELNEFWDPSLDYESDDSGGERTKQAAKDIALPTQRYPLSTWKETETNVIARSSKSEHLKFAYGESLVILGQFKLKIHEGLVSIAGTILTSASKEQVIVTTRIKALPAVKCISSTGAEIEVFHFTPVQQTLQHLDRLSPLFSDILPKSKTGNQGSFIKLVDDDEEAKDNSLQALEIPATWQQTINNLCDGTQMRPVIVQVCGASNSGKATFSQLLLNNWLSIPSMQKREVAVAVLDINPNKSEHSLPGQISLVVTRVPTLSPACARPQSNYLETKIIRSHAIGLDGFRENREHYLEAVKDLLNCYKCLSEGDTLGFDISPDLPLIIACPAWYQGSGMDLNVSLTQVIRPSHIICLGESSPKAMGALQNAAGVIPLPILQPQPYQTIRPTRTLSELRDMQLLSYFHSNLYEEGAIHWEENPLTTRKPYIVSYKRGESDFAAIFIFGEVPVMYPNMLSTLLNGSLVSIIVMSEKDTKFIDLKTYRGEGDSIPYFPTGPKGYTTPFNPSTSSVIGVALIRSIDAEAQTLHILTPISMDVLARIPKERLVLAFGALECPGWAYTEDLYYREWAKGKGEKSKGAEFKTLPWVEEVGEESGRVSGVAMQAWKARRFQ